MMKSLFFSGEKIIAAILILLFCTAWSESEEWQTPFEKSDGMESATWQQAIDWYQKLANAYEQIEWVEAGKSDVGKPLHTAIISKEGLTSLEEARRLKRRIVLINNGIHAGEPCGIDASMMIARDLVQKDEIQTILDQVVVVIIPVYNIGGALNRGCCSRANQMGPREYGFRGNARNYDLNRDFIKADTHNAQSFARIFHSWKPDIFVDTHTTNGADYQATLTYIPTHPDKLHPALANYMRESLIPAATNAVVSAGFQSCPYVNTFSFNQTPDKGFAGFLDLPRYSSGYAGLFQTLAFITEAHMLKPFADRVRSTYAFLWGILQKTYTDHDQIGALIDKAREEQKKRTSFDISWQMDRNKMEKIIFHGFEAKYKKSQVTGKDRLYYDRSAPFTREVPYMNELMVKENVPTPKAYILPQAYEDVAMRMQINGVDMFRLEKDTALEVEIQYITELKTSTRSYEGHFFHREFETQPKLMQIPFFAGDWVIFLNQEENGYIVHVLEPKASDSFFRWNFFDGVLMRKEYFSPYVFEEEANKLLEANPDLRISFEQRIQEDSVFADNAHAQLNFLYQNSPFAEPTVNRYPVARWLGTPDLPVETY